MYILILKRFADRHDGELAKSYNSHTHTRVRYYSVYITICVLKKRAPFKERIAECAETTALLPFGTPYQRGLKTVSSPFIPIYAA